MEYKELCVGLGAGAGALHYVGYCTLYYVCIYCILVLDIHGHRLHIHVTIRCIGFEFGFYFAFVIEIIAQL